LELCEYFDYNKLNIYINALLKKLNRIFNHKIIILETDLVYPHQIDDTEELSFWYGEFYDIFVTETNKTTKNNTTRLKKFLEKNSLIELQETFNYKKII
jgi:hypothetical protein